MEAVNYSYTRANLTAVMDKVAQDRAPILVTRQKGEPVVVMSLADYNALEETAYLLRSPKNAQRLTSAVQALQAGRGVEHALIEEPSDED
jgi:antitoxin YefM